MHKKGISWRVFFFLIQKKGEIVVQKNWRSRKSKIKHKRKWKRGESETWLTKTKNDEKHEKFLSKEKQKKAREIHFKIRKSSFHKKDQKERKIILKVFVRNNAFRKWKRIEKKEKEDSSERKKPLFCQISLGEKNLRRRTLKHNLFLQHLGKMANRNLFCFWKINKNENPKKRFFTVESTNKEFPFLQQKEDIVFTFFQRCSTLWKKRHWKNDIKRIVSEKMLHKKKVKEKRR